MNEAIIQRASEVIKSNSAFGNYAGQFCVLSLFDDKGYPTSSVLTASKSDGIQRLTFCTGIDSNKAKRIEKCNKASVCFCGSELNITLVGTIEIVTDPKVKQDMWYNGLESHFKGADDLNYCVLKFTTERYNLLVDWQEAVGTL